jgi:hypothetical protein
MAAGSMTPEVWPNKYANYQINMQIIFINIIIIKLSNWYAGGLDWYSIYLINIQII